MGWTWIYLGLSASTSSSGSYCVYAIHATLAKTVADGLALAMPDAVIAAREPVTILPPSDNLSIFKSLRNIFEGREGFSFTKEPMGRFARRS